MATNTTDHTGEATTPAAVKQQRIFVTVKDGGTKGAGVGQKRLVFAESEAGVTPFFDLKVKEGRRVVMAHKDLTPSELKKVLDSENAQAVLIAGIAALQTASDGKAEYELEKVKANEIKLAEGGANSMSTAIPESVKANFIQKGNSFYYRNDPATVAFIDQGNKLRATDVSAAASLAIVTIAKERGWESITLTGTNEFRRLVWAHAAKAGLDVIGYSPDKQDYSMAGIAAPAETAYPQQDEPPAQRAAATPTPSEKPKATNEPKRHEGILVEHGWAPYKNQADADMSYRIKLQSGTETQELWGVSLATIMKSGAYQKGDHMAITKTGTTPVEIGDGDSGQTVRRNSYAAEKIGPTEQIDAASVAAATQALSKVRSALSTTTPTAAIKVEAAAHQAIENAIAAGKKIHVTLPNQSSRKTRATTPRSA